MIVACRNASHFTFGSPQQSKPSRTSTGSLKPSPSGTAGMWLRSLPMPGSAAPKAVTNARATIACVAALRAASSIRWRRGRSTGSDARCRSWSRSSANYTRKTVDLYLHQQGLDTGTPAGKAMFQMLGVFAEFERAMIVERVKAGLSRARSQGNGSGVAR